MDRVAKRDVDDLPRATFAGWRCTSRPPSTSRPSAPTVSPYTVVEAIVRGVFTFDAGSTVFEVVDDTAAGS